MRLEKAQQRGEQRWIPRAGAKLVSPDSGQLEEPVRPTRVAERCRECGYRKRGKIPWGICWRIGEQSLTSAAY